ncbi:MAG: anthranilate synthase component I [Gemmatimonadota bacterium]
MPNILPGAPAPDIDAFRALAGPGRVVPVFVEFPFDTETAVTAYAKLRRGSFGFLLESVIGGERWARYSFLGSGPREAWKVRDGVVSRWTPDGSWAQVGRAEDALSEFGRWLGRWEPADVKGLPRFWGGAVGFFGYDIVRWFERLPDAPARDIDCPDACFLLTDCVLIIDNLFNRAHAVTAVPISADEDVDVDALYAEAVERLRGWLADLREPCRLEPLRSGPAALDGISPRSNRTRQDYEGAVERIREYIRAGDAFQVVLSQRLEVPMEADSLAVYRALRSLNPSPYLYLLELDSVRLIGASPEVLVRVEEGEVTVRPIAGTRPRGSGEEEDRALADELLADGKERAEHLMLVDLGRNDVGRVAEAGSVRLAEFMTIERYSHVMHMVSEVTGRLRDGCDALDAFRACFPAGTLTGAPKIRAMEIIDELEPTRRGPYGGAAGYIGWGARSLDMAIAIRTIVNAGERAYIQAGAGIVHDSVPEREWQETRDKARALVGALARALPTGGGT